MQGGLQRLVDHDTVMFDQQQGEERRQILD
jgi:hypothetical protein